MKIVRRETYAGESTALAKLKAKDDTHIVVDVPRSATQKTKQGKRGLSEKEPMKKLDRRDGRVGFIRTRARFIIARR
jgi:hypothetical protein